MRKFKFVGDPGTCYEVGKIYDGTYREPYNPSNVFTSFLKFPDDWQEVTDQPSRIQNQDMPASSMTKFEMAVFMVLRGPMTAFDSDGTYTFDIKTAVSASIEAVKETFKQLENETDRH